MAVIIYCKVLKRIAGFTRLRHHHPLPHHHHHQAPLDQMEPWACQDPKDRMDQKDPRGLRDFPDHPAYQDIQEIPLDLQEDQDEWGYQDHPVVEALPEIWEQWDPPEEPVAPGRILDLENERGKQRNLGKLQD